MSNNKTISRNGLNPKVMEIIIKLRINDPIFLRNNGLQLRSLLKAFETQATTANYNTLIGLNKSINDVKVALIVNTLKELKLESL